MGYAPRPDELEERDLNPYGRRVLRCLDEYLSARHAKQITLQLLQELGGDRNLYLPTYDGVTRRIGRRQARAMLADGADPRDVMTRTDLSMRTVERVQEEMEAEEMDA